MEYEKFSSCSRILETKSGPITTHIRVEEGIVKSNHTCRPDRVGVGNVFIAVSTVSELIVFLEFVKNSERITAPDTREELSAVFAFKPLLGDL